MAFSHAGDFIIEAAPSAAAAASDRGVRGSGKTLWVDGTLSPQVSSQ